MTDTIDQARIEEAEARTALAADPHDRRALRRLGRALAAQGRLPQADNAAMAAVIASSRDPAFAPAIVQLSKGELQSAESQIRALLARDPEDAFAIFMLGDLAARLNIHTEAERLLRRALSLAPSFEDAWLRLAGTLHSDGRTREAIAAFDEAIARNPDCLPALEAKVRILTETGEYDAALSVHEKLLALQPDRPGLFVGYGNTLKTIGRTAEAIEAYRSAIALDPAFADAWWALSNLKSYRFDPEDIARVEALTDDAAPEAAVHYHFALGKAHEDARDHARAFHHYAAGNRTRRALLPYDRRQIEDEVERMIAFFDRPFLDSHRGMGSAARDPIFIVGMPRAGSTLVEQILSSHSQIEGTSELPEIPTMVRNLVSERWRDTGVRYPDVLASLSPSELAALGGQYLARAKRHRKTDRPFFIDKLPINWLHAGLIHTMLPRATIIDARREAMACCFANFKQHFARGQLFSCSLADTGHQYRCYTRLMAHFDEVLPGRIFRLQHEELLERPEATIRGLLDHIGVPFEEGCLRFHENARAVRTPSAEQVRRPLNRDAVDLWRSYEPWLDELKAVLGPLAPKE